MRNFFIFLLIISCTAKAQPDIILHNGKIFTSDKNELWVDAIAIKGERIWAVGKNADIVKLKGANTRLIDLRGKLVIPGFNDAHDHVGSVYPARRFKLIQLPTDPTPWSLVKDSISRIVKEVRAGTFIVTEINPELLEDPLARRKALDEIAPEHPVILSAWTGHGKIMNAKALEFFGLDSSSQFFGGRVDKDRNGELTGILEEYAGFRIGADLAKKQSDAEIIAALQNNYEYEASMGITTVQNMGSLLTAAQAERIYSKEQFACRVRIIAFPLTNEKEFEIGEWEKFLHPLNQMNYISGIKMILDGTPVERLACFTQPYSDRQGVYGRLNFNATELKNYMEYCLAHGQQIIIHAVGDSSTKTIIRTMRALHPDSYWKDKRLRIEHGDNAVMQAEDLNTLKTLGIVIVPNPTHLALPQVMAQRLGAERSKYLQAMRSLLDNGIMLAIGSDGPNNPYLNLMLATFHPDNPGEAITLQEALIAYTYGSAYAEFMEKEKGTLTKGKLADLAVLSQNIFEISPDKLPGTVSELTIVGGKIVYEKK